MKQLSLVFIITFIIYSLNLNSSVTHIWPSSGTNDTTRSVHIFGDGFNRGVSGVSLQKSGYPNINATNITVINDNYLTCDFNLTGISATTYNLIVNSDTLDMCFSVNNLFNNYSQTFWHKTVVGNSNELTVGDGNNDGQLEVYGANYSNIYQFKWIESSWYKTSFGTQGITRELAVGDGNNDGELKVYEAYNNLIFQYTYNASSWSRTTLGNAYPSLIMTGVTVGDGNNDGQLEVYGATYAGHIYQFSWNGFSWDKTELGSGGSYMLEVAVGDGNNDGQLEVYGANGDGTLCQFSWNGSGWDKTALGSSLGSVSGVAVGDGNNDDQLEIYGTTYAGHIYQFSWNGSSWDKTDLGSGGSYMLGVAVGDGNNDGKMEVYVACYDNHIYQFSWNGSSWDKTDIGFGLSNMYMNKVAVGDGNNDGQLEVYGASYYEDNIYQFQIKPEYLSELKHKFFTFPCDSLIWELYIKNVAYQDIILDSIIIPISEYSITNYSVPDTINSGDSSVINVMFKSDSIGFFSCTLQIFLNDPCFPVWCVYLEGICDSTLPTKVDLIFPDSSGYSNSSVEFCWHPSYDTISIDQYIMQYALDSDFTISLHEYYILDTFLSITSLPDSIYYWRVKAYNSVGLEGPWSNVWSFTVDHLGIEEEVNITNGFRFSFASFSRDRSIFRFSIPELSNISLKIYDIAGREVSELISGKYQPGSHEIPFNPERSGMYFYRIESEFLNETGKFTILR